MTQPSQGRRRGSVFSVRVTDDERERLEAAQAAGGGPRGLGPWLVWKAIGEREGTRGSTRARREVVPEPIILDLCGGSGSWSLPYRDSGYLVYVVDLRETAGEDVRTFVPPVDVHGVLAAPPCTEFSIARNGHPDKPRDFAGAMDIVNACMRIILQCRPKWWALENPTGHLSRFLGTPRDTWEPCDFGDPWTKRTSVWGDYHIPARGPFVEPTTSAHKRSTPAARAITPPGFARAFFEANP